jgi:hypothetical protein
MSRPLGMALAGLATALVGLLLWVSGIALRWLDGLVLGLFAVGLALSVVGYLRGGDASAKRLAVVGIGVSALGVVMLAVLYAAG